MTPTLPLPSPRYPPPSPCPAAEPQPTPHHQLQRDIDHLVATDWRPAATPLEHSVLLLIGTTLHRLHSLLNNHPVNHPLTNTPPNLPHPLNNVLERFPPLAPHESATFLAWPPHSLPGVRVNSTAPTADRTPVDLTTALSAATSSTPTPTTVRPHLLLKCTAERCATATCTRVYHSRSCGKEKHQRHSIHFYILGYPERPPFGNPANWRNVPLKTHADGTTTPGYWYSLHAGFALWDVRPVEEGQPRQRVQKEKRPVAARSRQQQAQSTSDSGQQNRCAGPQGVAKKVTKRRASTATKKVAKRQSTSSTKEGPGSAHAGRRMVDSAGQASADSLSAADMTLPDLLQSPPSITCLPPLSELLPTYSWDDYNFAVLAPTPTNEPHTSPASAATNVLYTPSPTPSASPATSPLAGIWDHTPSSTPSTSPATSPLAGIWDHTPSSTPSASPATSPLAGIWDHTPSACLSPSPSPDGTMQDATPPASPNNEDSCQIWDQILEDLMCGNSTLGTPTATLTQPCDTNALFSSSGLDEDLMVLDAILWA